MSMSSYIVYWLVVNLLLLTSKNILFRLVLKAEHPCPIDAWCSKVNLIVSTQQIFLCAETNLIVCNAKDMRTLFIIKSLVSKSYYIPAVISLYLLNRAHTSGLICSTYSTSNRVIITGSLDTEVKVWSAFGGHLFSFRGHSRSIIKYVTFL